MDVIKVYLQDTAHPDIFYQFDIYLLLYSTYRKINLSNKK